MAEKRNFARRRVAFGLSAPGSREVFLVGDFNGWDKTKHPMKKDNEGLWGKTVMIFPGRYEYKFLVDGEWQRDPVNQEVCDNDFGTLNSVIFVK
ncbi:MAG: glycoside hydrolase [Deltaproteobacteria bacterium CG_4_8_14_3_um_filter_51_11]|nr:glycoside hydrolase [bacterium]OIP40201.1 MAG: hypothetical protein AUK25_08390 [Desulfobacteraceae bacterium CG2_30_51_40]PIP46025.1 MAG: glycoside hydrolase [Deltaproteobacteria bacterium CG23_combo_of_CG06-09_8_20_14_all_51_20]PIW00601.1 MAG: glycoside hydrolase [Deltaproteobacteria bacterium CG17_big_fil_post_rev_8_21_14_2_50_51_6]PIX20187.1 MAG: glycoside hydrolase [Deltaproteobacteria bacterium CG_4_8_14_3_um_filter_51_11]PIY26927.1 MAG: glycoside hydrolase [Deltaproteobacteria bacter